MMKDLLERILGSSKEEHKQGQRSASANDVNFSSSVSVSSDGSQSRIVVNGKSFDVPSGANVSIAGRNILINGKPIDAQISSCRDDRIIWQGPIGNVQCDRAMTIEGNVSGDVKASGSVACGSVGKNVDSDGSVTCEDIGGGLSAGGSVCCGKVNGNIKAGGSVISS